MKFARPLAGLLAALALGGALTACGDDSDDATTATETTTGGADGAAEAAEGAGVAIDGAWARTSPTGATTGAAYLTITAATDDALLKVSVEPSVAAMAEIHETVMAGHSGSTMATGSTGGGTATTAGGHSGAMTMREVERIDLPGGEAVALEPGGYHIMLMELAAPLKAGSTIKLVLTFDNAGDIEVDVPVRDNAP